MEQFDLLRYQGRFAELRNVLEAERDQTIGAGTFNSLTLCCVGKRPLAEYRGWTALLVNDVEAADEKVVRYSGMQGVCGRPDGTIGT